MLKKHPLFSLFLLIAIVLTSCAPAPAQEYVPVETIVAATYAAIAAQTEAARPPATFTPLPPTATRPPGTATPTPTATFVISTLTPTFTQTFTPVPTATLITSGSGTLLYACDILSIAPKDSVRIKVNQRFQWNWEVENIGTTRWDPDTMDAYFIGGTQMSKYKGYPISGPAKPGKTITVQIDLVAPKEPGNYTTTWALRKGVHRFCYMKLDVEVYK